MFMECYELEYLDISNFDILNATSLQTMFSFCHKLINYRFIQTPDNYLNNDVIQNQVIY